MFALLFFFFFFFLTITFSIDNRRVDLELNSFYLSDIATIILPNSGNAIASTSSNNPNRRNKGKGKRLVDNTNLLPSLVFNLEEEFALDYNKEYPGIIKYA